MFREELKFTVDEVALAMCLGKNGALVVYKRDSVITYRMRHKYFPNKVNRDITRSELEKAILKAIADKEDPEEVVGLLVLYLFTTVLFPKPPAMCQYTCSVMLRILEISKNIIGQMEFTGC